jgi:glycosyltransferase involved in cell wall biosynthesis
MRKTMTNNPLVSVIIPTYNRCVILPRSVDSVIGQTYQNWELIIVSDRSSDDTDAVVKSYTDKNSRIKLIKNESDKQWYPAGARNKGVSCSMGKEMYGVIRIAISG